MKLRDIEYELSKYIKDEMAITGILLCVEKYAAQFTAEARTEMKKCAQCSNPLPVKAGKWCDNRCYQNWHRGQNPGWTPTTDIGRGIKREWALPE